MSRIRLLASAAFAASLTALYSSNSSAQWASSCVTVGEGTPGLAIAADWYTPGYLPSIDLAERYLALPGTPITAVDVCVGSAAVNGDLSGYDYYLGPLGDAVAYESVEYSAFAWSKSIPVLYAPNAALNPDGNHGASALSDILTGLPSTSANRYLVTGESLSGLSLVPLVVVGNPTRPWAGTMGQDIMLAMGYAAWASPSRPPSPPARSQAWGDPATGYAVAVRALNGVKSAFITKDNVVEFHEDVFNASTGAQYPGLDEGFYVEFQAYAEENAAVRLSGGAAGDDFWAFLNSGGAWNSFLARWGYVPPIPFWNSTDVYDTSDQIIYEDKVWEALWWTQNEIPGTDDCGPWQEIASAADGTALWTPSRVFQEADLAIFEGQVYEAQWWTRNEEPTNSDPWGPWIPVP